MSAIHPDEATLLRWVLGELPERKQADVKRHVTRCRPCRKERDRTKSLHERLAVAGDALAFAPGDPFEIRPAWRKAAPPPGDAMRMMAGALGRLEQEKAALKAAIEEDASKAGKALKLENPATRLAAAHRLEEAAEGDSSKEFMAFADAVANRFGGASHEGADDVDAVVERAQLAAVARLVIGNWRLFCGRQKEAAEEFAAAWAKLAGFDAPEHLVAWVETCESLCRSYEGRVVEGRLLAERALGTFERYGLARGVLRARHARAVALYMASEFREAHREFRAVLAARETTILDRARAVSGTAFCLAARGRFHEAAKEYSRVRRRLRGDAAQVEQVLLQGEMKAALGTAGRWHERRDGLAAFALPEAGGAFHARDIAADIVKLAGGQGIEAAKARLAAIEADPARGYALLYAAQLAMPKVSSDPAMYVEFAKAIESASRSLPFLKEKGPAQPVCREQVMGEAQLLESSALNFLGEPSQARKAAQNARGSLDEAGEDSFALALTNFFEGSAASFENEPRAAWTLLRSAHSEFQLFGQENWQGRAEAALGVLLLSRGSNAGALRFLDEACRNLHPERDSAAYATALVNRGYALVNLHRYDAAKVTYAKALLISRRPELVVPILIIRSGLATIELEAGSVFRALNLFERLAADAEEWGIVQRALCARVRVAECFGRAGRQEEMLSRLRELKSEAGASAAEHDPALRELFASLDEPSLNHELLSHVARFMEARDCGARAAYRPFKLVASGN